MLDVEVEQSHKRTCFVCGASIEEVKKASAVSVGSGLSRVAHDDCLIALQKGYDEYEDSQVSEQYDQDKAELGRLLETEAGKDVIRTQARALRMALDIEDA